LENVLAYWRPKRYRDDAAGAKGVMAKHVLIERFRIGGAGEVMQVGEAWIYTADQVEEPWLPAPFGANNITADTAKNGMGGHGNVMSALDTVIWGEARYWANPTVPPFARGTKFYSSSRRGSPPPNALGYHQRLAEPSVHQWWKATLDYNDSSKLLDITKVVVFSRPSIPLGASTGAEDGRRLDNFVVKLLDANDQIVWEKAWDGGDAFFGTWIQAYPGKALAGGRPMIFDINANESIAGSVYSAPPF